MGFSWHFSWKQNKVPFYFRRHILKFIFLFFLTIVSISANQTLKFKENNFKEEEHCLAKNIFYEAGNQEIKGKIAVAYVTLNRTKNKKFPKSICNVVYQRNQFSWTIYPHKLEKITKKDRRWKESCRIAKSFRMYQDPSKGSIFFHTKQFTPYWACKRKKTVVIGNHIFYK